MRSVRFGDREIPFEPGLLGAAAFDCLAPKDFGAVPDAEALVRAALAVPAGPRLRDLARGARSAVVLVPGIDRVAAVPVFAMPLLRELDEAGIPRAGVKFYLATGTHEHNGPRDLRALVGPEIAGSVEGVVHDCRGGAVVRLGVTARGTPVELARAVVDSEVRVLTGRVVPHYFAGFGGGRKALLPGVASYETIAANHRLTLSQDRGVAPGVGPCALAGNPVHLDMLEAARFAKPTFGLSTVLDVDHRLVAVFAGDWERAHEEACALVRRTHQIRTETPFDGAIVSAGGAPYDTNFMQSLKAVFNVQQGVRSGGPLLWIAECPTGASKAFLDWAAFEDDDALERAVRSSYNLAGHNSIMLRHLTRGAAVGLVSSMPPAQTRRLGLHPLDSVDAGLRWLAERLPPRPRVAFVPFGNITHLTAVRESGTLTQMELQ